LNFSSYFSLESTAGLIIDTKFQILLPVKELLVSFSEKLGVVIVVVLVLS
jgi:hypothetical protein